MSDKLLKLVKRLRDAALDLYHEPVRSHVPVDRSDLREIVDDWSRLVSDNLTERLEAARLKAEIEAIRKDAERLQIARALVQKLCDAAGDQPSVATGYLHDILAAMGNGEQS